MATRSTDATMDCRPVGSGLNRVRLGHFQLVMVNRHLHRPTLLEIVDLLAPGGRGDISWLKPSS